MRAKGLHDIAMSQNVRARPQADTRARRLAELARLEREKDRLTREAEIWGENLQRTMRRLQEIESCQQALLEDPARGAGAPDVASGSANRPPEPGRLAPGAGRGKRWQTVPLEY